MSIDNKISALFDAQSKKWDDDYEQFKEKSHLSCLHLVGKLKHFVNKPSLDNSSISPTNSDELKPYNTNCVELANFISEFNKKNEKTKFDNEFPAVVDSICTKKNYDNKQVTFSLCTLSPYNKW